MSAILTVAVIGSALYAWFCVFWLVPRNLRGMFRYRLWRLRDELADDIHAGRFRHTDEPHRVVQAIECFIECAEELTPARISLLMIFVRPKGTPEERGHKPLSLKALCPEDKELLGLYITRFNKLVTNQVFRGSPSGWFAGAFLFPAVRLLRLYAKAKRTETPPAAYDVRRRTTEASLSVISASHIDEVHAAHPLSTYGN